MKNFLSAVYSEMSNRIKTPLIGTFGLCWFAYNHDYVAKLVFSDNSQRISLIEQTPFFWSSDLFIPLGFTLLYTFLIPSVQWGIDVAKYWLIEKRRTSTHHLQLLEKYKSQTRVAKQQSKASTEYWHELNRNHAENAGKRIIELKDQIADEKAKLREVELHLSNSERNHTNLTGTNEKLNEELHQFRDEVRVLSEKIRNDRDNTERSKIAIKTALKIFDSKDVGLLSAKFFSTCSAQTCDKVKSISVDIKEGEKSYHSEQFQELIDVKSSELIEFIELMFEDIKSRLDREMISNNRVYMTLNESNEANEFKGEPHIEDISVMVEPDDIDRTIEVVDSGQPEIALK